MQFINFILKRAFIQSEINRSKVDFSKTFNFTISLVFNESFM